MNIHSLLTSHFSPLSYVHPVRAVRTASPNRLDSESGLFGPRARAVLIAGEASSLCLLQPKFQRSLVFFVTQIPRISQIFLSFDVWIMCCNLLSPPLQGRGRRECLPVVFVVVTKRLIIISRDGGVCVVITSK